MLMYNLNAPKPLVDEEDFKTVLELHTKNEFPREFAYKTLKKGRFYRNEYVWNVQSLYAHCLFRDCIDCYVSVYSFNDKPEDGTRWDRTKAIIDTVFLDLDFEGNLYLALKDAKKIIKWCFENNITPRTYFSGAKGFHIYLDFDPLDLDLEIVKEALKRFGVFISRHLELKTLDTSVLEVARIARVPLTLNSKTNYLCTPISPQRLLKMTDQDVLKFAKEKKYDFPEIEPNDSIKMILELTATQIVREREERERRYREYLEKVEDKKEIAFDESDELHQMIKNAPNVDKCPGWMIRRALLYINALRRYGCLAESEIIRKIHSRSEWVAKHNYNKGAIEHIARVHFVLILLTLGLTDDQIHQIFKLCKDYDYRKTQYFIDYNRRCLERQQIPSDVGYEEAV